MAFYNPGMYPGGQPPSSIDLYRQSKGMAEAFPGLASGQIDSLSDARPEQVAQILQQIEQDRSMREQAIANQNRVNAAIMQAVLSARATEGAAQAKGLATVAAKRPDMALVDLQRRKWEEAPESEFEKQRRFYMNKGLPEDQAAIRAREVVSPSPAPKVMPEKPQQPTSAEQMRLEALATAIRRDNPKMSEAEVTARAYAQLGVARRAMSGNPGVPPGTQPSGPPRMMPQGSAGVPATEPSEAQKGAMMNPGYTPAKPEGYASPESQYVQARRKMKLVPNPSAPGSMMFIPEVDKTTTSGETQKGLMATGGRFSVRKETAINQRLANKPMPGLGQELNEFLPQPEEGPGISFAEIVDRLQNPQKYNKPRPWQVSSPWSY